jgi:TRAP-type mannitol/chloroaromatic compound transport system permease large subunit
MFLKPAAVLTLFALALPLLVLMEILNQAVHLLEKVLDGIGVLVRGIEGW